MGSMKKMNDIFNEIYKYNAWGGTESISGPGSSTEATRTIISELPHLIEEYNIKSILDAPCGDFNWMKHIDLNIDCYIGVDIIPEMIRKNNTDYGTNKTHFFHLDLSTSPLPKTDLIICRDCLVHFSFHDIRQALNNFKNSSSKYLLTTTFTERTTNVDITTGDWRPLNLQADPLMLPKPIFILNEQCKEVGGVYSDKSLALWKLVDIPYY